MNPTSELINSNLSKLFKKMRYKNRMNQKQVSEKLSISISGYSKIERGLTDINTTMLRKIGEIYSLTPAEVLQIALGIAATDNTPILEDLKVKLIEKDAELNNLQQLAIKLFTELHG